MGTQPAWDASRRQEIGRKPAKFPFLNLLAATVWAPESPRSAADLEAMSPARQGAWHEWTVAQELFRRAALGGGPEPERIPFWQGDDHEVDFVASDTAFVEAKRGRATALDFAWFRKAFARAELTVVCATPFEADRVRGVTLDEFLHGA